MRIDDVNKWLNAIQAVAVIAGVVVAIVGVVVAIQTLRASQVAQSATLVLQLRDKIEASKYKKITDAIQDHDQKYALLPRAGSFRDIDIEDYIGNFEDIGSLVEETPLLTDMAYNHFSYDIEKAWCNRDVQKVVAEARKADKSATASSDKMYGRFEQLALSYLGKEHQTCDDLDKQ